MNTKKYAMVAAIVCLTLVLWYVFLITPEVNRQNEIEVKLAETRNRIDDFKRIMHQFSEYFDAHLEISGARASLISKLYSKADLLKLFECIEQKISNNDLQLIEISPSVEELLALNRKFADDNHLQPLDIIVRWRGSLQNTGSFIEAIEAENFYQGVNHFKISNPAEGRPYSDIEYGFKVILGVTEKS